MVLTNVYGARASTVRAAFPALVAARGQLVLTGSVAGRVALPGSLYSCTKSAVTAMAEAVRQELGPKGVRVLVIEPGMVRTPFFEREPEGALEGTTSGAPWSGASRSLATSTSTRSSSARTARRRSGSGGASEQTTLALGSLAARRRRRT